MILDTNAVSALAQKNQTLIQKLSEARRLAVTVISLGEYTYGTRQSRFRLELETWLRERFLPFVEILFPNLSTVEHYVDIRTELKAEGTPIPANDIWIAALARQYSLPVLSLDQYFDQVKLLDRIAW